MRAHFSGLLAILACEYMHESTRFSSFLVALDIEIRKCSFLGMSHFARNVSRGLLNKFFSESSELMPANCMGQVLEEAHLWGHERA